MVYCVSVYYVCIAMMLLLLFSSHIFAAVDVAFDMPKRHVKKANWEQRYTRKIPRNSVVRLRFLRIDVFRHFFFFSVNSKLLALHATAIAINGQFVYIIRWIVEDAGVSKIEKIPLQQKNWD